MLDQIIIGIIGIGGGVAAVIYARKIVEFTGLSATMERYLGDGGTYLGVRIIGSIVAIFSFLYMFGLFNAAVSGIGNFFGNMLFGK